MLILSLNAQWTCDIVLNFQGKRSSMINVTMTISNMYYHEDLEDLGSERSRSLIASVKKAVSAIT